MTQLVLRVEQPATAVTVVDQLAMKTVLLAAP